MLPWRIHGVYSSIRLMVQKSGDHQLRLVVYPGIYRVFIHPKWLFGISEPSTVHLMLDLGWIVWQELITRPFWPWTWNFALDFTSKTWSESKFLATQKKGEHLFLNGFQEFGGDCEDPIHWDVGMTKVVTFSTLQIGNWKWRPKRTETTEMKFIRLFSTNACWEFCRFGMILYRTQVECCFLNA